MQAYPSSSTRFFFFFSFFSPVCAAAGVAVASAAAAAAFFFFLGTGSSVLIGVASASAAAAFLFFFFGVFSPAHDNSCSALDRVQRAQFAGISWLTEGSLATCSHDGKVQSRWMPP